MRVCTNCGAPATSPVSRFCVRCGATLPEPEPGEVPAPLVPAVATPGYPYMPGYPYGPGYPYAPVPSQRTSGAAVTSLILGIVAYVIWFAGFLVAPAAIITGVVGRRSVDRDPAAWKGRGLATAGFVLGLVWMIIATLIISALVFARLAELT